MIMPYVFKAKQVNDGKAYKHFYCPKCLINSVFKVGIYCDNCDRKNSIRLTKRNLALIDYLYDDKKVILALEQLPFQYDDINSVKKLDRQFFFQFSHLIKIITKTRKKKRLEFFPMTLIICIYSIKKFKIELRNNEMELLVFACFSDINNALSI